MSVKQEQKKEVITERKKKMIQKVEKIPTNIVCFWYVMENIIMKIDLVVSVVRRQRRFTC